MKSEDQIERMLEKLESKLTLGYFAEDEQQWNRVRIRQLMLKWVLK